MLGTLRKVRKRKRPRHLVHVDACMWNLIRSEGIEQRRQRDGLPGTGRSRQQYSEHALESSSRRDAQRDSDLLTPEP